MKMLIIINPKAGRKQIQQKLFEILEIVSETDYVPTVYLTKCRGDARYIASLLGPKYDCVVCCGGDGTLNEVICGLMRASHRPILGYIPCGTTNDVASSLGLTMNIAQSARNIVNGSLFDYDIGKFNDRHFVYIAAMGIFSDVPYKTNQQTKNAIGNFAYFFEAMKQIQEYKPIHLRLESGDDVYEDDYIFCSVSNTYSIAGIVKLSHESVSLNDGQFDVMLIKDPKNMQQRHELVMGILNQSYDISNITYFQSAELQITTDDEIPWCLDGEDGGKHKKVHIKNYQGAISFIKK